MGDVLFWAAVVAAFATLAVLAIGIGGFGTGKMSGKQQNRMMRLRIIGQATAVVLVILAVLLSQGGQ